jgi:hypothetical protein
VVNALAAERTMPTIRAMVATTVTIFGEGPEGGSNWRWKNITTAITMIIAMKTRKAQV